MANSLSVSGRMSSTIVRDKHCVTPTGALLIEQKKAARLDLKLSYLIRMVLCILCRFVNANHGEYAAVQWHRKRWLLSRGSIRRFHLDLTFPRCWGVIYPFSCSRISIALQRDDKKRTTQGRLMLDIYATTRQSYRRGEIRNIGLFHSVFNIADGMKKLKGNGALFRALVSRRLMYPVENYIVRPCEMYAMRSC
jgi:hypothetical protein